MTAAFVTLVVLATGFCLVLVRRTDASLAGAATREEALRADNARLLAALLARDGDHAPARYVAPVEREEPEPEMDLVGA